MMGLLTKGNEMKNPIQPIINGRFKENKIVRHLLDWASERGMGPNELAVMEFSKDDRVQFAQLIGYSFGGFGSLSYVDDDTFNAAAEMNNGLDERDARIKALQDELDELRKALQIPMARLFGLHEDDLARNINEDD
jgi:hypothetical protein